MPISDQDKLRLLELEQEQHVHEQTKAQPRAEATPLPMPSDNVDLGTIRPNIGMGESAARGALQGATFGLSDEGAGVLGAGQQALQDVNNGNDLSLDKLKAIYQKHRDIERVRNKQAEEANPNTYNSSEFVGGIATPGLGLLGTATKLAKGAPLIARLGNAALNTARGSVIGAGSGALSALGNSESSDPTELGQQATEAGKTGALIGAAPGLAGIGGAVVAKPLGFLYNQAIKFQPARIVGEAIRKGYEGKNLTDLEAQFSKLDKLSKDLGNAGLEQKKALSGEYEALKQTISMSPDKVDLGPYVQRMKGIEEEFRRIKSPEVHADLNKVNNTIQNYTQGLPQPVPQVNTTAGDEGIQNVVKRFGGNEKLSPQELFDLQKLVGQQASFKGTNLATEEGRRFAQQADNGLKDLSGEAIPELNPLNEKYAALKNSLNVFGIDSKDAFVKNAKTGELEMSPSVLGKIQGAIRNMGTENAPKNQAKQALGSMLDNLEASGAKNTNKFRDSIADHSDDFEIARDIAGKSLYSQSRLPALNLKNTAFVGNLAAKGAHDIQQLGSDTLPASGGFSLISASARKAGDQDNNQGRDKLETMSKNVYSLDNQQLHNMGDMLKKNGSNLGDTLKKAIVSNDSMKKNATLFNIMQNPELRKLLNPNDQ